MTNEESRLILGALEPLGTFMQTTEKPLQWHATWQTLWRQALQRIAALEEKPKPEKANPEEPKPEGK